MQLRCAIAATVLALWSGVVPIIQFAGACDNEVLFAVEQTPNGLQCNAETKLSFTRVSVFIDSGVHRGCTSACRAMIRDVQTRLPEDCYLMYYPTGFGVRPRSLKLYAYVIAEYMPDCLKDGTTSSPLPTPTATATVTPPTPTTMAPTATPQPSAATSAPPPAPTPTPTTALTPPPTSSTPPPTTAAPLPMTQTPAPTTNSTPSSKEEAGQVADNDTSSSLPSSFAPTNVPSLTKQPLRSPTATPKSTPKSAAAIADAGSLQWLLATMVAVVLIAQSDSML